jgi:hypothetical protein
MKASIFKRQPVLLLVISTILCLGIIGNTAFGRTFIPVLSKTDNVQHASADHQQLNKQAPHFPDAPPLTKDENNTEGKDNEERDNENSFLAAYLKLFSLSLTDSCSNNRHAKHAPLTEGNYLPLYILLNYWKGFI